MEAVIRVAAVAVTVAAVYVAYRLGRTAEANKLYNAEAVEERRVAKENEAANAARREAARIEAEARARVEQETFERLFPEEAKARVHAAMEAKRVAELRAKDDQIERAQREARKARDKADRAEFDLLLERLKRADSSRS